MPITKLNHLISIIELVNCAKSLRYFCLSLNVLLISIWIYYLLMSLLAEQTYGWQICLIRKLLAFASFPAPVSVIYDLPILYLVILMTQEFCTSKCVLWPAFRVFGNFKMCCISAFRFYWWLKNCKAGVFTAYFVAQENLKICYTPTLRYSIGELRIAKQMSL